MIRKIVMFGDPVLRSVGSKVAGLDEDLRRLAADMLETMRHADGVGLAAQQVGVAVQMAVVDVSDSEERPSAMWVAGKPVPLSEYMPMVLVNPVLELGSEKETGTEGCLSFPGMQADISRSAKVRCRTKNLDGTEWDFEASGLLARALQHEVDHLNGVLFIDRMSAARRAALSGKLKRLQKGGR